MWAVDTADKPLLSPWHEQACASLRSLEDDWDGYGANAPLPGPIARAERFLSQLGPSHIWANHPDVMATPEGGVFLEWDEEDSGLVLILDFEPDDSTVCYVKSEEKEAEGVAEWEWRQDSHTLVVTIFGVAQTVGDNEDGGATADDTPRPNSGGPSQFSVLMKAAA